LDEAESIGIRKSYEALADADLVLVVVDASAKDAEHEEERLLEAVGERRATTILVENKADLAAGTSKAGTNGFVSVRTSALTGEGIKQLREEILRHVAGDASAQHEAGFLTNARHQGLVNESLNGLDAAEKAVRNRIPHEMLLLDLYSALRPLDSITGETSADDILNLIFGSFCIGK
jgi:tRNA modification GTPase